jgi:hypothetical protein
MKELAAISTRSGGYDGIGFAVGGRHTTVDRVRVVGLGGPHLGRVVRETPEAVDADAC